MIAFLINFTLFLWTMTLQSSQGLSLPTPMEDRLPPPPEGKFFKAAAKVDFKLNQRKLVVSFN